MQTPGPLSHQAEPDVEGARLIIESALAHGRHLLNEMESKALLSAFHIPIAQTLIARDPMEAMLMAQQMGFPVAMKINSPDITHKSDVNGVRLGLSSGQAVRSAYRRDARRHASACAPTPRSTASSSNPWRHVRMRAKCCWA